MSDNLKKGVSILYDMELNNYLMTKSIGELNQKISQLRQKLPFYAPEKPESRYSIGKDVRNGIFIGLLAFGIIGYIIGLIIGKGDMIFAIPWIFVFFYLGIPVGIILGRNIGLKKREKAQQSLDIKYNEECNAKRAQLAVFDQENYKESNILFLEKESLIKRKAEATQKLNEFYEAMGIDEKFRNIVPIGYMNDFLRLGIANKLEGADGLYYLIMKELRWDQLQHSLEDISYRLDAVIDHQKALYHELVAMNYKCDELVKLAEQEAKMAVRRQQTLEQIEHNTSVAAYNAKRVEKEVEFSNFMHINHM